jgi:hypothetical protein
MRLSRKDYEAYYIAVHVGEWLRDNARKYWGSSKDFQEIQNSIGEKMDIIHDEFKKAITQQRGA